MIVGFSSHRRDIGRGVMAYFFAPFGTGADGGLMRRNPVPELLCGDPGLFSATVQALRFHVNRHAKLTPYRRPILTPYAAPRSGPEPTELITEWRRVRP